MLINVCVFVHLSVNLQTFYNHTKRMHAEWEGEAGIVASCVKEIECHINFL